jgi:heme exporter protein B
LDGEATFAVAVTLMIGTPALTLTGMIGAALAVSLRRGGLLLAVLVLPLSIPVLIFGVAASTALITADGSAGPPLSILAALSLIGLVVGPIATAASLRHGLE